MVVSELDQEHYNGDPFPSDINRILHPIPYQDMLGIDLVSNLEIIPRNRLKALPSHQILRSIIPSLGENINPPSHPNFFTLLVWDCVLIKILFSKSLVRSLNMVT